MPESMRKDVEKSLQDLPPGRKKPERYTRKVGAELATHPSDTEPIASGSGHAPKAPAAEEDTVLGMTCFPGSCLQMYSLSKAVCSLGMCLLIQRLQPLVGWRDW